MGTGVFEGFLLVSDLDNTLFGEKQSIPQKNSDAIEYFISNGGYFTFATGRGIVAAKKLTKGVPRNAPAILFNGAVLYDFLTESVIYETGIRTVNAKKILKDINNKFPDIPKVVFYKEKMRCV